MSADIDPELRGTPDQGPSILLPTSRVSERWKLFGNGALLTYGVVLTTIGVLGAEKLASRLTGLTLSDIIAHSPSRMDSIFALSMIAGGVLATIITIATVEVVDRLHNHKG